MHPLRWYRERRAARETVRLLGPPAQYRLELGKGSLSWGRIVFETAMLSLMCALLVTALASAFVSAILLIKGVR